MKFFKLIILFFVIFLVGCKEISFDFSVLEANNTRIYSYKEKPGLLNEYENSYVFNDVSEIEYGDFTIVIVNTAYDDSISRASVMELLELNNNVCIVYDNYELVKNRSFKFNYNFSIDNYLKKSQDCFYLSFEEKKNKDEATFYELILEKSEEVIGNYMSNF